MLRLIQFTLFLCLLMFAIAVQVRTHEAGWGIDAVLATLLVVVFWATLGQQLWLIALSVFLLNWRTGFAPELLLFAALPLTLFLMREYFPWRRGVTLMVALPLGLIGFYLLAVGSEALLTKLFLFDMITSMGYATALFLLLKHIYEPSMHKGRIPIYSFPR